MNEDKEVYNIDYYYREEIYEYSFLKAGVLRPDQASAVAYAFANRTPKLVISVGCGVGLMEEILHKVGVVCYGIDPCKDLPKIYKGEKLLNMTLKEAMKEHLSLFEIADTFIFNESYEHIIWQDTEALLDMIDGRLIITNRLEYHPINPHSWDHIAIVNDEVFEDICKRGKKIFQLGSHLVVDIKKKEKK